MALWEKPLLVSRATYDEIRSALFKAGFKNFEHVDNGVMTLDVIVASLQVERAG